MEVDRKFKRWTKGPGEWFGIPSDLMTWCRYTKLRTNWKTWTLINCVCTLQDGPWIAPAEPHLNSVCLKSQKKKKNFFFFFFKKFQKKRKGMKTLKYRALGGSYVLWMPLSLSPKGRAQVWRVRSAVTGPIISKYTGSASDGLWHALHPLREKDGEEQTWGGAPRTPAARKIPEFVGGAFVARKKKKAGA